MNIGDDIIATKNKTGIKEGLRYLVVEITHSYPWVIDDNGVKSFLIKDDYKEIEK